jgi:cellulose synthase/poly-beta-1,6-N-acetylglucosamine synthase-like glycosyltransferase
VYGKEEHFVQKYLRQKMKPKGKMSSNLKKEVVNSVDDNRKNVKTKCKGSNICLITKIFKVSLATMKSSKTNEYKIWYFNSSVIHYVIGERKKVGANKITLA